MFRRLWQHHRFLLLAFALAAALTTMFAVRAALLVPPWRLHLDAVTQPVEAWMTPRYAAHAYDIPPDVLTAALDQPPLPRQTFADLAARRGEDVSTLLARVQAAILAYQRGQAE